MSRPARLGAACAACLAAALAAPLPAPAFAQGAEREAQPLWEAGVGGGALYAPDYPASDEHGLNGLALPYLVYRGDIFRLGDDSIVKGVLMVTERFEFDVSFDASFDADSDGNDARRGMPDLDFLGEAGPRLTVDLGQYRQGGLQLALPVRAVFSTDFSDLDHRGFLFNPELSYRRAGFFDGMHMSVELGATFATERLQDYFYQVDARFANAARPAFDADGGYMGSELDVGFSFRLQQRLRLFTGAQAAYRGGAANEDSPLYRDDLTISFGAGFVWSLYESDARAGTR